MSETEQVGADQLPPGEYAIIELFGRQTMVGRITEVERFGAKMLALEPLFNGKLLPMLLQGGAAIYRLTPCSPQIAWAKQPMHVWQLPTTLQATLPPTALPATQTQLDLEGQELFPEGDSSAAALRDAFDDRDDYDERPF
jgi:hypothetical protein